DRNGAQGRADLPAIHPEPSRPSRRGRLRPAVARGARAVTSSYLSFRLAKEAMARGENVTQHLRQQLSSDVNTPPIIEMAYDLQAGTYVEWLERNREFTERYTTEMANLLNADCRAGDSVLDVGTGEMTTFCYLANRLKAKPR